jgi:lipopolysaccharide transport system ATP-binding protein
MKPAVTVENLSKLYRLGGNLNGSYRTLRESVTDALAAPWNRLRSALGRRPTLGQGQKAPEHPDTLWALNDVCFDVRPGEVVGIIGRNGAGKSTLLKVLSRITEPSSGRVTLRGRVGSLLEVGTGFHHELTGRENIYLNGAILGMARREIARKFDEIVAFAEVEQFLDTPVKRYSSGMFVRLAFAVASHMDPEILVVDEVLAVGDAAFQKKCLGKLGEVSRTGRTVLFVSHNMATILHLCKKVVLLERGRLAFSGDCRTGVALYTDACNSLAGSEIGLSDHPRRRPGCKPILAKVRLLNGSRRPTDQLLCGEPIAIEVWLDPGCSISRPQVAVGVEDTLGARLFTAATYLSDSPPGPGGPPRHFLCRLDQLPLTPGRYCLTLNAGPLHAAWADVIDQAVWFDVTAADFYGNGRLPNPDWGRFLVRSRWTAVEEGAVRISPGDAATPGRRVGPRSPDK